MKAMKNLMLASLLIGLGACSNYEQDVLDASKYITVDAGFGTDSRVATNGLASVFQENDAIGVYAWTGGKTLPSSEGNFQVYNVANTYDGTNWTATPQMLWKDDATPHYFLSVYPKTDILTTATYTLNPSDQVQSDLLIATNFGDKNEGIAPQSNPVPLAFGHVMAKLRVNIKFTEEFATTPTVEHVTAEAKATATIDWQTATATATGDVTGIELPALATAAQGYACSYESVMVPQSGFKSVVMVIGGETYTFTSNQAMQLEKGTITTLNLSVGRTSIQAEDISILDWTTGASIDGYLNNISEQITAIKASLVDLEAVDTELNALIKALQDAEGDHEAQIAALKAKDAELDGKIAALQAYVNSKITATEDWANTTFATLAQYQAVLNDIADINLLIEQNQTAIEDITNNLASMQTAIDNLQTSMQTWVNDQLQEPLADIATLQADLTNLSNSVATDAELTAAIAEQQTALDNAMNGVSQTISDAITAAIENDGMIDLAISQKIDAAKTELQSQISTINSAITTIQDRLDKLEKRIQSIRFLPEYSDGKVKIGSASSPVELTFIISPKEAAAIAADKVTAFIYHTQSRAVDAQPLDVTGVIGDATTGMLTVSVTPPAETYWATGKTANIYIQINDGNNDIISEMIPAYYDVEPDYVTFSATEVQTFSWAVPAAESNLSSRASRSETGHFEYSVGGDDWATLTEGQSVNFGGTNRDLRLRGIAPEGTNGKQITFGDETPVTCSGDIRTLVDYTSYATTSTKNACFASLFTNCSALADASGLKLISNNNEMAASCYVDMFNSCTSLESAPELPAKKLAQFCYQRMFAGCTSLESAPELPAKDLAASCYVDMFNSCTSLESAPELPAEDLAINCYSHMFASCSTLVSAPVLSAKKLVTGCYWQMFSGCTNLNSVTMLATDISGYYYLTNWLEGVAATGTFTKAEGMTAIPTNSTSGIPTGWTVKVKSVEQEQETLPGFNYVNGY